MLKSSLVMYYINQIFHLDRIFDSLLLSFYTDYSLGEGFMDYNNNEIPPVNNQVNNNNLYTNNQPNGMATASLILGILAVVSICCVYGSYLFGGIAITLGLLSRGKNNKLSSNALIGTILSIVGMVVSTIIIVVSCITLLSSFGSFDEFMDAYESYYENIYGDEFPFDSDLFNNDFNENTSPYESDLPNTLTITIN